MFVRFHNGISPAGYWTNEMYVLHVMVILTPAFARVPDADDFCLTVIQKSHFTSSLTVYKDHPIQLIEIFKPFDEILFEQLKNCENMRSVSDSDCESDMDSTD